MKKFFLILILAGLYTSCVDSSQESFKPGYSGAFGELVVIMDKQLWNSSIGDTTYEILGAYLYGFPQDERQLNIVHVTPEKFKRIYKTHRNICIVKIDSAAVKPITLRKSRWAKGQMVVTLSARTVETLRAVIEKHAERAAEIFMEAELNRLYLKNKRFGDATLAKSIEGTRNLKITLQKDAVIDKNDSLVTWVRVERERNTGGFQHQISQGLMIFELPYTSRMNFLDTNVYTTVDSLLKIHLPGPRKGQYMQLNYQYVPPKGKEVNFKGQFAKEYRGLWRMENNAMGGPMNLLVTLDEKAGRVLYVFGYVYAPQFDKREYMREVEGMIKSISLE